MTSISRRQGTNEALFRTKVYIYCYICHSVVINRLSIYAYMHMYRDMYAGVTLCMCVNMYDAHFSGKVPLPYTVRSLEHNHIMVL